MAAESLQSPSTSSTPEFAQLDDFVRWGYPRWWNLVTGELEVLVAALIAQPLVLRASALVRRSASLPL